MNDVITEVHDRSKKEVSAYVRFDRVAVEDRAATKSHGRYIAKDVDFAYITPPFSKDEVVKKAAAFLEENRRKVEAYQLAPHQAERFEQQYKAWLTGQELPVDGTPIKGWAMISPAQQAMLIERKILTVEVLAKANDDGLRMIGMGANSLRQMAQSWLAQAEDRGPLTMEMKALSQENAILKGSVETLTKQVNALMAVASIPHAGPQEPEPNPLSAASLLADEEPPPSSAKRGKR
jgi:hypothetical protein